MAILNISGVDMPAPVSYKVSMADIQSANSGRSDGGYMSLEVVRSNVASIDVAWENLTQVELETVSNAIAPSSFSVVFYYGSSLTADMYKSDRSVELNKDLIHWNISFSLISL